MNSQKKIIVAGNWKMNKTFLDAVGFMARINQLDVLEVKTILAVPSVYADSLHNINQYGNIHIALQNASQYECGAYTGEVSAVMIASLGIKYCIVGHSERRQYFGETDEIVGEKAIQLLQNKITPIFCVGETLAEREAEDTYNVIRRQILKGLKNISIDEIQNTIIAYEPVWAIGTGVTATKEQAQEIHQFIYNLLAEIYSADIASQIPILYGGSCNEKNAQELFEQPNIWGGLIGGASLNIDNFYQIMQIAEKLNGK